MDQNTGSKIVSALAAERNALIDFIILLEREQNALVENNTDLLLDLAEQKSVRALALSELVASRHLLLKSILDQPDTPSITSWLQSHSNQGLSSWMEIRKLGEKARQLNQSSGELIQMRLRHNQQALMVLNNAANKANVYGPDGQPNLPGSGTGRTLGSV